MAYAVGSEPLKHRLSVQYPTLRQDMAHELAIVHPELDGRACDGLSYFFASMMHAHWSLVAILLYARQHRFLCPICDGPFNQILYE